MSQLKDRLYIQGIRASMNIVLNFEMSFSEIRFALR